MSLNELMYKNLYQNELKEEQESSEASTSSSSSNIQSGSLIDSTIEEFEVDEKREEDNVDIEEEEELEAGSSSENEDEEQDEAEKSNVKPMPAMNQAFQQNCLAAAQMMHLMSSNGLQTTNTSTENEKENIPICKYCNKIFANFSNLNHHISAIHLNQSKWVCSQCGKICSSKSNLKVHLRVHLRVKPYHCRWCSYSCMHHSSIRDHLAKVHPDKTHTPLQPGYLFNSQAVPEPEVFNSKGFNANSFVNESVLKREANESPEKIRSNKKAKLLNNQEKQQSSRMERKSRSPNRSSNLGQQQAQTVYPQVGKTSPQIQLPANQQQQSMSNLYNAYTMARMFPFMYSPMQMQYAAAAMANNQVTSPGLNSTPNNNQFLGMFNQYHQSRAGFNYGTLMQDNTGLLPGSNVFSSLLSASNNSSSDEHPTNSSGNYSYSGSSRSSSLSPSSKSRELKQMSTSTSTDEGIQTSKIHSSPTTTQLTKSSPKTLTVDQMLNNSSTKVSKETQTEPSCLKCPYCSQSQNFN